ncbi:hypothetical protein CTEN210_02849 [Chaetoceros tenuissimus]|uniref:RING-type domain-containing protein n=1 Tax=Chaetoceros tenuissimus TaxID=426638 RepID=A0AAD3CJQ4_9STRA|nr:hypothetical protein CTEN210_02849 [Chaetoceros tenuissimus]
MRALVDYSFETSVKRAFRKVLVFYCASIGAEIRFSLCSTKSVFLHNSAVNTPQGNDKGATTNRQGENEDTLIDFDMKMIDEFNLTIYRACKKQNWERIENFLSDNSISNQEKRMVFEQHDLRCCRFALIHGAPSHIIKGIIEVMDPESPQFLTFGDSDCSWLHSALRLTRPECPRVQKHIEAFEAVDVAPKEFYDWIEDKEFDQVRRYLDSEKVSREAKMKCINVDTELYGRPFYLLCRDHGPIDIAERIIDIMGKDFLFLEYEDGNNCLHIACDYILYGDEDDDNVPTDGDIEAYCDFVAFLLSRGGWKLLLETNKMGDTALCDLMLCKLTNLECVKLVLKAGGHELLAFRDEEIPGLSWGGNTILHYASWRHQPDREVIKYLVSVGGPQLTEMKSNDGRRAEDSWSDELKEYIAFTTKTSSALSDDLQCPICFDTLFDVHVISQCCHRFCKSCITQSYEKRGSTCPVCRAEYSISDVKKDPLLSKLTIAVKEEKDAKEVLQVQLLESQNENDFLREQVQKEPKRKHDEL